jgi:chaperonin GroES
MLGVRVFSKLRPFRVESGCFLRLNGLIFALALFDEECQLTNRNSWLLSRGLSKPWATPRKKFTRGGRWSPMKIRPLGDRILVKRIKEEEKTKGGIIIPDTAKEKPQEGKVVAVGKGKMTEEGKLLVPDVKAGDKILFGKYSGSEVKLEGEEHLILREDDILGVLEG